MAIQNFTDIGLVRHPANRIAAATNSRSLYLGLPNDAAQKLLVRPAQSLAIIRLPDRLPDPVSQAMLVLVEKPRIAFIPILAAICWCYLLKWSGLHLRPVELQDTVQ